LRALLRKLSWKKGLIPSVFILFILVAGCTETDVFDFSLGEIFSKTGEEESLESLLPMPDEVSPSSFRGLPVVDDAIGALPSVVEIEINVLPTHWPEDVDAGEFFGHPFESFNELMPVYGAGIVLDSEGYILTNYHLVEGASEINVKLVSGASFSGEIIGSDVRTDICVLKITPTESLIEADIGDSEYLSMGEWVVVLGNPYGLGLSASMGIVSALERSSLDWETAGKFIQTDAPMNPGNSGGALVNLDGEVVGIVSAMLSPGDGIGFAIPINNAVKIAREIIETGTVKRGWLGVEVQDLDSSLAEFFSVDSQEGALVSRVEDGSPAYQADIREGDVIVGFGGEEVGGKKDLRRVVANANIGESYDVDIVRDGMPLSLSAEIGEMTSTGEDIFKQRKLESDLLGLFTVDVPEELKVALGINYGVLVTEITNANSLEILPGDVILSVNMNPAQNRESYLASVGDLSGGEKVVLLINRSGNTFFSTLVLRKK
jgi:serine protease Do